MDLETRLALREIRHTLGVLERRTRPLDAMGDNAKLLPGVVDAYKMGKASADHAAAFWRRVCAALVAMQAVADIGAAVIAIRHAYPF